MFSGGFCKASNIQTFEHVWNEVGRARCLLLSLDRKIDLDSSITVCNDFQSFSGHKNTSWKQAGWYPDANDNQTLSIT